MDEQFLLTELKKGSQKAYTLLFNKYYKDLVLFGGNFLPNKELCEDIVQSVFMRLWRDKDVLDIETSLKSYLLRSVQNRCLDELRHKKVIRIHETYSLNFGAYYDYDTENYILYSDLEGHLEEALSQLPEPFREAFLMNRMEGLKYREIAEKLNVSERTVEVRIGKALSLLRNHLKDFFKILLLFWHILK